MHQNVAFCGNGLRFAQRETSYCILGDDWLKEAYFTVHSWKIGQRKHICFRLAQIVIHRGNQCPVSVADTFDSYSTRIRSAFTTWYDGELFIGR